MRESADTPLATFELQSLLPAQPAANDSSPAAAVTVRDHGELSSGRGAVKVRGYLQSTSGHERCHVTDKTTTKPA